LEEPKGEATKDKGLKKNAGYPEDVSPNSEKGTQEKERRKKPKRAFPRGASRYGKYGEAPYLPSEVPSHEINSSPKTISRKKTEGTNGQWVKGGKTF